MEKVWRWLKQCLKINIMNLNKGSRLGEGSIMNICTWLIQKSDEKLSVLGRIRAKSKSELYQYLIKSVRRKAFAELMIANQGNALLNRFPSGAFASSRTNFCQRD